MNRFDNCKSKHENVTLSQFFSLPFFLNWLVFLWGKPLVKDQRSWEFYKGQQLYFVYLIVKIEKGRDENFQSLIQSYLFKLLISQRWYKSSQRHHHHRDNYHWWQYPQHRHHHHPHLQWHHHIIIGNMTKIISLSSSTPPSSSSSLYY